MYQVLYRKWRPQAFADVSGQDHVTTALRSEIKNDRLAHAYLFTGSRGTGKTTCAKILAKAVNCLHPVDGDPCNECEICRGIDSGAILDVTEIDAASNNGVDSVRVLREEVNYTPTAARFRVYIIDEVHMLSVAAFNALLKTLEEPPAHVIFILATTEVHRLPATILSRCQRFDFHRITPADIAARLQFVAQEESVTLDPDAAELLARLADGALRDALSLLDQCVSRSTHVTVDTVTEAVGSAGREALFALSAAVREQRAADALEQIGQLHAASRDMERLCADWIEFYRGLMLLRSVRDPGDMLIASPQEIARMREEAARYDLADILHCLDVLQTTLERLKSGVSRRTEMEMAVIKLCMPSLDSSPAALLRRITVLENRATAAGAGVTAAPASAPTSSPVQPPVQTPTAVPQAATPPVPTPVQTEPSEPEKPLMEWSEVLDTLLQTCPPLAGALMGSSAVTSGDRLIILSGNQMFRDLIRADNNAAILKEAVASITGRAFRFSTRNPQAAANAPKAAPDALTAFLQQARDAGVEVHDE